MKQLIIILIPIHFLCIKPLNAQNFINSDLNGTAGTNNLPTDWQFVPYDDPICLANVTGFDSPDVTDQFAPSSSTGIAGIAYSGNTFVSGLNSITSSYFQEGIMQNVSGFIPGNQYEVNFYQSVVKQLGHEDTSGTWLVYLDMTLIGVSPVVSSQLFYNDLNLIWESVSMVFTATETNYTIKFLPRDDDVDLNYSENNPSGGLRMGIDLITINPVLDLMELSTSDKKLIQICDIMGRDSEDQPNTTLIYIYSDGTTEKVYRME